MLRREDGQTMAEYGVTLTVITLATITALAALSGKIVETVTRAQALLPG
jgi:Flp pilus assembly pilin Flp